MAKNILIVDDEPTLVKGLRFNLEQQEGYVIDVAMTGKKHSIFLIRKSMILSCWI